VKCPKCGYHNTTIGRPKLVDEENLKRLSRMGLTIREMAAILDMSHGGVHAALKRLEVDAIADNLQLARLPERRHRNKKASSQRQSKTRKTARQGK
jgi:hypothetical protein